MFSYDSDYQRAFMDCSQGSDGFGPGRGFGRGAGGRMGGRGFGIDLSLTNCILLNDSCHG